ncbi:MAG: hypothetical protein WBN42_00460 [Ignavibacteriaceae bacterium]
MHTAVCQLQSVSPYSQSKYIQEKKTKDETHQEFEQRIWRERMHATQDGYVFIPPMAFKNCLSEAAKYKSTQVPGKGKTTYTKHIESGVMVMDPLVLDIKRDDVPCEWLHLPSDGRRGGTKRVEKCFGIIHDWSGTVTYHIYDELVNEDVFRSTLEDAGAFIGIGRFRPRNNGFYGRYRVIDVKWS